MIGKEKTFLDGGDIVIENRCSMTSPGKSNDACLSSFSFDIYVYEFFSSTIKRGAS